MSVEISLRFNYRKMSELITAKEIAHLKKIFAQNIETDEDYLKLADLTEDESGEISEPVGV
jgi:hypothetical protein